MNIKPPEIKVTAKVTPNTLLKDRRIGHLGLVFGTVDNVCRQYGIKYTIGANSMTFYGTKLKMQMLIETLHFARASYIS